MIWFIVTSIVYIVLGFILGAIGVLLAVGEWKRRKKHQLVSSTPTTDIRAVNSEGVVEFTGTISGSVDDSEFVSPIGQTPGTVCVRWLVQEWSERGDRSSWRAIAGGTDSVPFYLDDGTDRIQVSVEDEYTSVTLEHGGFHDVEEIDLESDPPAHITTFIQEHDVEEPAGSITNIVDLGNTPGDRRYSEWSLGIGDEIYLLGNVHAVAGATMPLHPENAIVAPGDNEPFILSDLSEDELEHRLGSSNRLLLPFSAFMIVLGAGLLIFGLL